MIRFFRVLFYLLRVYNWRPLTPWSINDAKGLNAYFAGTNGRKLIVHLRNESLRLNHEAIQLGELRQVDRAYGFMYALAYLQNLSAPTVPQTVETSEDSEEGIAEFLERVSP